MISPNPILRRDGFALLITITLLAFLVLLLVSLASLTRVETVVAQNNQTLAQARQNALLGLGVALGQLQRHAGPDRRVTARADIGGSPSQPGLTGVWDTSSGSPLSASTPTTWLISGNEGANPLAVTPSSLDPVVAATANEVFLVSNGTVSTDALRIKAPKQVLQSNQSPGLSGNSTIGSYAWWVGDENVKARIALQDPHADSPAAERVYSFISSQRPVIEHVVSQYPKDSPQLESLLSLNQLPLIASTTIAQNALSQATKDRFYDLSPYSASVLADVAAGGLKKDLTAWLSSTGSLPSGAPGDTDPIIPAASGGTDFMRPQWGIIRSWNGQRVTSGTAVAPQQQTQSQQGRYPVITFFRLGMAISQGEAAAPLQPFRVHLYPTLVLWNPFNVAIEAPYELCFLIRREGIPGRYITFNFTTAGTSKSFDHRLWRMLDGPARSVPYLRLAIESTRIEPGQSRIFTLRDADDEHDYDPANPGNQTLTSALNVSNSVVIASSGSLTAAERASPVQWSTAEGAELTVVLREAGLAEPVPAGTNWDIVLPGAYQTVQRPGFGNAALMPSSAVNPLALGSQFYWQTNVRLSNSIDIAPRWIAQSNYRAPLAVTTGAENASPHFVAGTARGSGGLSFPNAPLASIGKTVTGNAAQLVLAEFLPPNTPLFSLAQLQHANLSLISNEPAYAVGNSLADYHIPLDQISFSANPPATPTALTNSISKAYDTSYLLNNALWDRYFLSTIPDSLAATDLANADYRLPNGLYRWHGVSSSTPLGDLRGRSAFDTAASRLLLQGGFNIRDRLARPARRPQRPRLRSRNRRRHRDSAGLSLFAVRPSDRRLQRRLGGLPTAHVKPDRPPRPQHRPRNQNPRPFPLARRFHQSPPPSFGYNGRRRRRPRLQGRSPGRH
jgi:hypothetical protein